MENVGIPYLFGTVSGLEEALGIKSLLGQGWIIRNVSGSLELRFCIDAFYSYRENIEGALRRISPSTSFTSTPVTGGPIEHYHSQYLNKGREEAVITISV